MRVDADDYVNRNFLEIEALFLTENKDFAAVSCDYYKVDNKGNRLSRHVSVDEPIACGVMYRREVIEEGYIENGDIWEDLNFVKRLNVYHIPLPLYRYLQHDGNLTKETDVTHATYG